MDTPPKVEVLGVGISRAGYDEITAMCARWLEDRRAPSRYICVASVHGLMEARKDAYVKDILNRADITTADGMPLVWALRSFGVRNQQRVYGPSLMLALCEQAQRLGHRVFFYGGRQEALMALCSRMRGMFPSLSIAGAYSPPFRVLTDREEAAVQRAILNAAPALIFVGISTPKQERWMASHLHIFPGTIMVGVGAAFDFHAGRIRQAPEWMQRNGLEWFFRLTSEPARLWKRYLLVTPWFIPFWALQKTSMKLHDIACGRDAFQPTLSNQ